MARIHKNIDNKAFFNKVYDYLKNICSSNLTVKEQINKFKVSY